MVLMVSVSGIRGVIGSTMTPQLAASAGATLGTWLNGGCVVVGRDSRPSGEMVQSGVIAGLLATGCDVVDLGVVMTPSTAVMVQALEAAGGVVLTASHNPVQWNGIKFLTGEGSAPPAEKACELISIFEREQFRFCEVQDLGSLSTDSSTAARHVERVLSIVAVEAIRRGKFRCVLDSVNGAGGHAGRMLLEALGCDVVPINDEPTGLFAHTPEPTKANLVDLAARTAAEGAAVGFAQDPDADRLAIIDERGTYLGEEYTLALAAQHVFANQPGPACTNLSTSRMIDDLAARAGGACVVHRSAVGEANVVEVMRREGCVIGGEGNGGVIDPRVVYVRDSLTAMALTLQVMTDAGQPLSAIVADLPHYVMVKEKFPCDQRRIVRVLDAVRDRFAAEKLSTIDGVRIDWPEGWAHVRGSNTEPILRVIGEAGEEATAAALIARVRAVVDAVA